LAIARTTGMCCDVKPPSTFPEAGIALAECFASPATTAVSRDLLREPLLADPVDAKLATATRATPVTADAPSSARFDLYLDTTTSFLDRRVCPARGFKCPNTPLPVTWGDDAGSMAVDHRDQGPLGAICIARSVGHKLRHRQARSTS
jgi:hypothetical protein